MDLVFCECKSCGGRLGEFINLWTQIGKSYFTPLVEPQAELNVSLQGNVRVGETGTLVEGCQLQDISCEACGAIVGLRCLETPMNHVLDANQVLLRISSIATVRKKKRAPVELVIKRYLNLKTPSGKPHPSATQNGPSNEPSENHHHQTRRASSSSSDVDISQLQADLDGARQDINRIDSAGFQVVSAINDAVGKIEREVTTLKDTVRDLQRDAGGNHEDLASLKSELKGVRSLAQDTTAVDKLGSRLETAVESVSAAKIDLALTTAQLQRELAQIKSDYAQQQEEVDELRSLATDSVATAKSHAKELTSLRAEVARLRRQMDQDRAKASPPPPPQPREPTSSNAVFPSRELDILTSNIAKIGNRASQVESLQMEFEMLKGRVERMEAAAESRKAVEHNSSLHSVPKPTRGHLQQRKDPYDVPDDDGPSITGMRRKRPSARVEHLSNTDDTPSKRLAFSSDYAHTPTRNHEVHEEWPQTSSPEISSRRRASIPKLTKSGSIDKRTLKRTTRKSSG